MSIKKIIAAAVTIVMVIGVMAGCGSETAKEVHFIIKTPPLYAAKGNNANQVDMYKLLDEASSKFCEQYDDAKVTADVVEFDYVDESKYITECFDTKDAVDVLFEGYFNMASYIYTGRVVSLDDIISEDLKEDFSEADLELSKVNGKTYMLPNYSLQNTLAYNKDLFRKCGLEKYIAEEGVIANWSIEEWETILDTLAKELPDMSYPMMMYGKDNQGDTHIMTLLRSQGCKFFDEDGLVCVNSPEGIAALEWLKSGIDKGWYPQGAHNVNIEDCMSLFEEGQLAICITNNASFSIADHEKYGLVNFPGVDDEGLSTAFVSGFMVFDNGDADKIKVSKDFLSFFYDNYIDYECAGIPSNKSVVKSSGDGIYMLDAYAKNGDTIVNFTNNSPNWQGSENSVREVFWKHIHNLLLGDESPEDCAAGIDRDCNAVIKEGLAKGKLHE